MNFQQEPYKPTIFGTNALYTCCKGELAMPTDEVCTNFSLRFYSNFNKVNKTKFNNNQKC